MSNRPSLHSNDFVRTIAPCSFKCSKNSVPPPTKPNGLLVANRMKCNDNSHNNDDKMIGLWEMRSNWIQVRKVHIFLTYLRPICLPRMVKIEHCNRDDLVWKMMCASVLKIKQETIWIMDFMRKRLFARKKNEQTNKQAAQLRINESIHWFCLAVDLNRKTDVYTTTAVCYIC